MDSAVIFKEFWNFEKGDSGDMKQYHYEMTEEEISQCMAIKKKLMRLHVIVNGALVTWRYSPNMKGMPQNESEIQMWENGKLRKAEAVFELMKWQMLTDALTAEGYPHSILHCIKYWVTVPTVSEEKTVPENIAEIITFLWECPGYV